VPSPAGSLSDGALPARESPRPRPRLEALAAPAAARCIACASSRRALPVRRCAGPLVRSARGGGPPRRASAGWG